MNPFIRLLFLVIAWFRKDRCPHHYHPWKGAWCICTRTHLHWGKHSGFVGPQAVMRWRNSHIDPEPLTRIPSWWKQL